MKIHILDDWFDTLRSLPCFEKLQGHEVVVWKDNEQDVNILGDRVKDADVLVLFRERTKITRELLTQLPKLKLISQRGVYPHVDVDACTDNGVLLSSKQPSDNAPNYAAAELTWALILASMRQIPQQFDSLKAGHWQMGIGKTLRGRTLGLYGYGRIARAVAEVGKAFGMEVIWWGSDAGRTRALDDGEQVPDTRSEFFSQSDVVSIHVRLKPETKGVITADDLRAMKKNALLVNTSRAEIIPEEDLLSSLDAGTPGMAAFDVFYEEPLTDPHNRLLTHPAIIATPHIGFVTEDELQIQFSDIFDQIVSFTNGVPINIINSELISG